MDSSTEKSDITPSQRQIRRSQLQRSNRVILLALVLFAAFFYALTVVRIDALPIAETTEGGQIFNPASIIQQERG